MKQERFDALTKTAASGMSRRGMLRALGGGIASAALAALVPGYALAAAEATKEISCDIKEKAKGPDGTWYSVACAVSCAEGAGYCAVCGVKERSKEGVALACAAACCSSDDPTMCVAPDKKEFKAGCKQGRIKYYKNNKDNGEPATMPV